MEINRNMGLVIGVLFIIAAGFVFTTFRMHFPDNSHGAEPLGYDNRSIDVEIKEIHKPEWGLGELAVVYKNPAEIYRASKLVVIGMPYGEPFEIRAEKFNSNVGMIQSRKGIKGQLR